MRLLEPHRQDDGGLSPDGTELPLWRQKCPPRIAASSVKPQVLSVKPHLDSHHFTHFHYLNHKHSCLPKSSYGRSILTANTIAQKESSPTALMAEPAPSINLAQIIALIVIGYFAVQAIRSWLSPRDASQTGASGDTSRRANNGSRVNPAHVEQVAQMFPQLDRRTIMWDLQRNGGSVQATTERVLTGRGLENVSPLYCPSIRFIHRRWTTERMTIVCTC